MSLLTMLFHLHRLHSVEQDEMMICNG